MATNIAFVNTYTQVFSLFPEASKHKVFITCISNKFKHLINSFIFKEVQRAETSDYMKLLESTFYLVFIQKNLQNSVQLSIGFC